MIVVTFNAEQGLRKTLDSLTTDPALRSRWEVIVVDGGSTDSTIDIARASEVVDRIIQEPDDGIYDAMNKGASAARGQWLHFLNAGDCMAGPESLGSVVEWLAGQSGVAWGIAGAINLGGLTSQPRQISNVPHNWWRHVIGLQPHCHQACWFDREAFRASGGYSLDFGTAADFDLIIRFGMLTPPAVHERVVIHYEGGGVSQRTASLTPALQHKIRVHRLQLNRLLSGIDLVVTRMVTSRNNGRIMAGRVKASLRR